MATTTTTTTTAHAGGRTAPSAVVSEGEAAPVTFYTHSLCPYAHRVALCLAEKAIPHRRVHVDLSNKPSWFLKDVNPRGLVPALRVESSGEVLTESIDVCVWLEDAFREEGRPRLVPNLDGAGADGLDDAAMRRLISGFDGGFVSAGLQYVGGGWGFSRGPPNEAASSRLEAEVAKVEDAIRRSAGGRGPFLMGAEITLADVILYPFAERFELAAREFKGRELRDMGGSGDGENLFARWMAAMAQRDSVAGLRPDETALLASWRRTMRLDYFDYETADVDNP